MGKAGWLAVRALSLGLALGLSLAAPAVVAETVLNRGNGQEPGSLDPHRTYSRTDSNILRDLFEGLVVYGPDGDARPGVAESWDISEDGLTYVVHPRDDARWSNGDAVTADDMVHGPRRALTPREGYNPPPYFHVIANAEAVMAGKSPAEALAVAAPDPRTVTITLRQPAIYFLALLGTDNVALPVHRPSLERWGEGWAQAGTLVGNGPFLLAERVAQDHVTLVRNVDGKPLGDRPPPPMGSGRGDREVQGLARAIRPSCRRCSTGAWCWRARASTPRPSPSSRR